MMKIHYMEENYIRVMLLHKAADGLHPLVDEDIIPGPYVVGHKLDLLLGPLQLMGSKLD